MGQIPSSKDLPPAWRDEYPELGSWAILQGYWGSLAYGTNDPQTALHDRDVLSICVLPGEYYLGLKRYGSQGTKEISREKWDIVVYEVKKFFRLLYKSNPNAISLLWLEEEDYLKVTPAGQLIIDNRELFLSQQTYRAHAGYARGQLERMETFRPKDMGARRKKRVDEFGFDPKNAYHLIRLMRMAVEFLEEGTLQVKRSDFEDLLAIRRGQWTLEEIRGEAQSLHDRGEELLEKSHWPVKPDFEEVNYLCQKVVKIAWEAEG